MTNKHVFYPDDLIEFEDGEYSDHTVWEPMRVIAKFNIREQASEFLQQYPDQAEQHGCSYHKFIAFLVSQNFLEEPDEQLVYRVWLGGYGKMRNPKELGV